MPPLTKLSVAAGSLIDSLVELIETGWKPVEMETELKYRNDLLTFLRANVPEDARLEKEYRHDGTTADIYLSWRGILFSDHVYFELKRNLIQKTSYDRLIGQLEGLDPRQRNVVLILVGEWDKGLVGRITERYKDDMLRTGRMRLLCKKPRKPRAKKA